MLGDMRFQFSPLLAIARFAMICGDAVLIFKFLLAVIFWIEDIYVVGIVVVVGRFLRFIIFPLLNQRRKPGSKG